MKTKVFTTRGGLKLTLKPFNQTLISAASSSVEVPKRPTYTARTMSGRVETHPMDEEVAKESPESLAKWHAYLEDKGAADTLRNQRVLNAIFVSGVEFDMPESDDWEYELQIIGIPVPDRLKEKKLVYLQTQLAAQDIVEIMSEVMRLVGVSEEDIEKIEASFPDTVYEGDDGAGQVVDAGTDS